MLALLRFLGFRRIAATWLAIAIVLTLRTLMSAPPEGIESWPYPAVRCAANSVKGIYQVAFGLWVASAIAPLRWLVPLRYETIFRAISIALPALASAGGIWILIKAAGAWSASPEEFRPLIVSEVRWVAIFPLSAGLLPYLWIEAAEHLRTLPYLARWRFAGQGAHASWISPYTLRKLTRPLPRKL